MLCQHFALKDLGQLHYFLSVETSWDTDGSLHLSQTKYIKDLLSKTSMLTTKLQPTLIISSPCFSQDRTTVVDNSMLYHYEVGSLQYFLSQELNSLITSTKFVTSCINHNFTTGKFISHNFTTGSC